MRILSVLITLVLIACLAFDPYSYGGVGGDRHNFRVHEWQIVASFMLVTLQISAVLSTNSRRRFLTLVATELLMFCGMNVLYVLRDGFEARGVVGNYSYDLPFRLVVSGLLVRLVWVMLAIRQLKRA